MNFTGMIQTTNTNKPYKTDFVNILNKSKHQIDGKTIRRINWMTNRSSSLKINYLAFEVVTMPFGPVMSPLLLVIVKLLVARVTRQTWYPPGFFDGFFHFAVDERRRSRGKNNNEICANRRWLQHNTRVWRWFVAVDQTSVVFLCA